MSDPVEAARMVRKSNGRLDLIITDVIMPDMNGRTLSDNLKSLCPDLKCLFMSGYTADVISRHGVLDEGVHFIQKPFSMRELSKSVRNALDGGAS